MDISLITLPENNDTYFLLGKKKNPMAIKTRLTEMQSEIRILVSFKFVPCTVSTKILIHYQNHSRRLSSG